ncbi:MAG: 50S ribosomal protein L4 [Propionibacteriaceae bacterium]|nr:50S ribosomal protein L4 [Propionibacteriaceae bacterium]
MSSITVDVHAPSGKKAGKAELPGEYFDVQTNVPLIHQVVVAQLAAARQGTHSTKTRGQVRGGGIKPWRQKGTGRARHGSRRSPIWTGGGTVHGPKPRDYSQRTPKKMIAAALRGALSDRARDGQIFVVSEIVSGETPSTKQALATLAQLGEFRKVLVVLDRFEEVAWLSLRNVPTIHVLAVDQLNTYDVLVADTVVFTSAALAAFTHRGAEAIATETEAEAEVAEAKVASEGPKPKAREAAAKKSSTKVEEKTEAPAAEVKDYGKDSYRGDKPPAGFDIKGNEDSMKFHTPESPWYSRTIAEVWFNSAEAAEAAGFVNVMEGKEKK